MIGLPRRNSLMYPVATIGFTVSPADIRVEVRQFWIGDSIT